MGDEVTIRTVCGLEGFWEIRNSWEAIAQGLEDRGHFFHRPEWYRSYLEALEENPGPVVFHLICRGGVPVAVLPLRAARGRLYSLPLRILEIPHHPHMPLSDFICGAGAAEENLLFHRPAFAFDRTGRLGRALTSERFGELLCRAVSGSA